MTCTLSRRKTASGGASGRAPVDCGWNPRRPSSPLRNESGTLGIGGLTSNRTNRVSVYGSIDLTWDKRCSSIRAHVLPDGFFD
jgi:hypothetical protein